MHFFTFPFLSLHLCGEWSWLNTCWYRVCLHNKCLYMAHFNKVMILFLYFTRIWQIFIIFYFFLWGPHIFFLCSVILTSICIFPFESEVKQNQVQKEKSPPRILFQLAFVVSRQQMYPHNWIKILGRNFPFWTWIFHFCLELYVFVSCKSTLFWLVAFYWTSGWSTSYNISEIGWDETTLGWIVR